MWTCILERWTYILTVQKLCTNQMLGMGTRSAPLIILVSQILYIHSLDNSHNCTRHMALEFDIATIWLTMVVKRLCTINTRRFGELCRLKCWKAWQVKSRQFVGYRDVSWRCHSMPVVRMRSVAAAGHSQKATVRSKWHNAIRRASQLIAACLVLSRVYWPSVSGGRPTAPWSVVNTCNHTTGNNTSAGLFLYYWRLQLMWFMK